MCVDSSRRSLMLYLHRPLLEDGGGVLSVDADGGGRRGGGRGSRREVIVDGIIIVGRRGERCEGPVDDVVVVGRVSETEVEELAPVQEHGVGLKQQSFGTKAKQTRRREDEQEERQERQCNFVSGEIKKKKKEKKKAREREREERLSLIHI